MAERKPDLLFLMTDHQRADEIGMIQCGMEITPNLNKLAGEGIRFTRAYNTCPLCVPARTALATGIYPGNNGVVFNDWKGEHARELKTIHSILKEAGYRVGHAGVDHIRVLPGLKDMGLDFFVNQEDYSEWADKQGIRTARSPQELVEVEEEIDHVYQKKRYSGLETGVWPHRNEAFKDYFFERKAMEFLEQADERPFALFVYLWAPHPPLKVPDTFCDKYDPELLQLPENIGCPARGEPLLRRRGVPAQLAEGVELPQWRKVWAAHLGLVSMADEIFGRLLKKVEELGRMDHTCVLFTADHGDHLGQHSMYQKMEMYEEAVKVPFILRYPGAAPDVKDGVVSHLDIVPTLCELLGLPAVEGDGISLVPYLRGEAPDMGRMVFSQYSGNPGFGTIRRAAISRWYKYVYDGGPEEELYDLLKDPSEMVNVAGREEYRLVCEEYRENCKAFHQSHGDAAAWS